MTREFDNTSSITSPAQYAHSFEKKLEVQDGQTNTCNHLKRYSEHRSFYPFILSVGWGHGSVRCLSRYNENQFLEVMAFLFLIYAPMVTPDILLQF